MNSDSRFQSLSRLLAALAVYSTFAFFDRAYAQNLLLDVDLTAVRVARFDHATAGGATKKFASADGAALAAEDGVAHAATDGASYAAADGAAHNASDVAAHGAAGGVAAGIAAAGSAAKADAVVEGIAHSLLAQAPNGSDMPPSSFPSQSAAPSLRKGSQLIVAGKLDEALGVFQDYCRMKPQDASGFFWMGICYDEMKNNDAAVHAYRDAVSKAEQAGMDSCELRTNLGNSLLKQKDLDGAVEAYKKALEINPIFGLADLNLGRAYVAKSDFKAALDAFAKCDELHFQAKQLQYYKAKALVGAGRSDEAGAIIQRLLQDLPPGENRESIRQEFQSCLPAPK